MTYTKDEALKLALEAGLRSAVLLHIYGKEDALCDSEIEELRQIEAFAALVADAEAKRMHDEGMVTVGHMRQQIAAEREAIIQRIPGGHSVDPQWVCDMIRARGQA